MEKLLLTGLHHIYRPECCFEPATQSGIICICNLNINVSSISYVLGKSQVHMLQLMSNTMHCQSSLTIAITFLLIPQLIVTTVRKVINTICKCIISSIHKLCNVTM